MQHLTIWLSSGKNISDETVVVEVEARAWVFQTGGAGKILGVVFFVVVVVVVVVEVVVVILGIVVATIVDVVVIVVVVIEI